MTTALLLFHSTPGHAWVCSRVVDASFRESGPSLAWSKRQLTYALHNAGTVDLPDATEFQVLRDSFHAWEGQQGCEPPNVRTDISFVESPDPPDDIIIGYDFLHPEDNENLLVFYDVGWPHQGQGSSIIALTTTTYSAQTGEILDADIEFNSQGFAFADLPDCCPNSCVPSGQCDATDLMNTAVHEIGHILGLGHPDAWQDIDPACASDATMCKTAREGDTNKRDLSCDDRNGLVLKYPAAAANGYCDPPACALEQEACGANCSPAACGPWAACGFCAPPTPLRTKAEVMVVSFQDGQGGCSCRSSSLGLAVAGSALFLCHRRRRYSSPPSADGGGAT